jgi:hypothetical protein
LWPARAQILEVFEKSQLGLLPSFADEMRGATQL